MHAVRPVYVAASVIWMLFIFWLSSIPELRSSLPSLWDGILRKCAHIAEYAVLYILISRSFMSPRRYRAAAIITLAYAISDEWHQTFVTGRHGSPLDVGIDALGIVIGFYLSKKPLGLPPSAVDG